MNENNAPQKTWTKAKCQIKIKSCQGATGIMVNNLNDTKGVPVVPLVSGLLD